jgi:hypothetical protein
MKKDKKLKKQKQKMPALIKFMLVKELWIAIAFLIAAIGLGVACGFTYDKMPLINDENWVGWILQIVFILIVFAFVIFISIAILKATGRRGEKVFGENKSTTGIAAK